MKKLAKIVLAISVTSAIGASAYVHMKKDPLTTNEALKNSVDRRLSVENLPNDDTK
jgi:hypothetical protein